MDNATMKGLRFGIEIETVGLSPERLAQVIATVVGGTVLYDSVKDARGRTWKVVPDGSLTYGVPSGEIVSPILAYEDIEQLQEVIRAVREAGARADASCGIHVHLDGSRFDARTLTNLVKTISKQERLIQHALQIRESRLNGYCRPIERAFVERLEKRVPRTSADVSEAWYGRRVDRANRRDPSRYHGLNLNSYFFRGSIEFRYFNGTLHAGEVRAYITFVLALGAKALALKTTSSKPREFNPKTAKYDFRVFLLSLGLIGKEFKHPREHLLKHLQGSAAWKGERRDRRLDAAA